MLGISWDPRRGHVRTQELSEWRKGERAKTKTEAEKEMKGKEHVGGIENCKSIRCEEKKAVWPFWGAG